MEELIAKRYAKALMESCSEKELQAIEDALVAIAALFRDWKVKEFIISPEVEKSAKEEILLAPFKDAGKKFVHLIKLLAEKDRLEIIPALANELKIQRALKERKFDGVVYSEFKLSDNELKKIAEALSKKVNGEVVLHQGKEPYDGIKVEVNTVGIEIEFSKSKIKKQLIENILKAI
ncbi:F0F1 ATP synthase subunit delta [Nitratiruptor sp. SB155-2]|uniref:ATP synthase subunit delta n=1 Tax=Nitratiruptor sp. (strain SB155-2) TaxID=387092 RepID=ATPD_NITSB|nr:F0F1 ATP synthase subunit delta [Nitratiruptor sp. SB155-2]A6Q4C3.1 RecName: Full=ATP synthase subunit delta; AltName: Full=ATP synthase F(1) sector subunit delta; AltName: Full=F-type ATPase subunit delta; Short=F-ATPase subunit delta [Nitratiruptor sp. SB155-2]BAF70332.1 F0F1-type ATP synthase, delta subunit [Nitratiruptor sp. SB155-2]